MATLQRPAVPRFEADTRLLLGALAVASAVELAILRLFTRTAIHIPALEQMQTPYAWLSDGGRFAYFTGVALLIPALALFALAPGRTRPIVAPAVVLFVFGAFFGLEHLGDRALVDMASMGAVAALSTGIVAFARDRRAVAPALFAVAFVAAGTYATIPDVSNASQPEWLLRTAEYSGVAFALTTAFMAGQQRGRVPWVAGGVVAAVVMLLFLGNGSTSRFLLLWNVGLPGAFPGVVYAVAGGALAYTLASLLGARRWVEAAGLVLLLTGGIGLHSTYQSGLVVTGLAALLVATGNRPQVRER